MKRSVPMATVAKVLAVTAGIAAIASAAPPVQAGESVSDCVVFQSTALSTGLAFDVENTCSKRLSCSLSWTLACENASGKVTNRSKEEARFELAGSDTHRTTGSSAACRDAWKIDDVRWQCQSAPK